MTVMEKEILRILQADARMSAQKIAAMLSADESSVRDCIRGMEESGLLVKYTAIVNSEEISLFCFWIRLTIL